MLRMAAGRLLQSAFTLVALSLLIFVWLRCLPGGPAEAMLGERATPEKRAMLRHSLGYDQPLWVQYGRFLRRVVTGDLGVSTRTGDPVLAVIGRAFPATVDLAFFAMVFAVVAGIPLGYFAACRFRRLTDVAVLTGTLVGVTVPVFFVGCVLKILFAQDLHWFPPSGRLSTDVEATHVTGLFVLDGLLTGDPAVSVDALWHLVLPALTLGMIPLSVIARITRGSVLEVLGADYVRTAEAKGLSRATIRGRHVLRNALLPVVTSVGLLTGGLLAGAVLTEKVYNWGGLGSLVSDSITGSRDYPVLQALILFAALVFILVNLCVDISYTIIDPRVRPR